MTALREIRADHDDRTIVPYQAYPPVLTTAHPDELARAEVHVQWDPERSLRGAALNHYSIQVGIGRSLIRTFAEEWVTDLTDLTPQVQRIAALVRGGQSAKAQRLLPPERPYRLPAGTARRLDLG
ncbi:DUF4291 family protein [Kitasatospora sp. NPDC004669]|uniref:DUF4291 family protein n=1 Tax=Kitasatospora sp. NPDC004669 TaxID=3154555 RepID=UPI0033B15B0B